MISEEGVLVDDTTSAPVEHIQLTRPTSSNVPDQKRDWLSSTSIGSTSKYGS